MTSLENKIVDIIILLIPKVHPISGLYISTSTGFMPFLKKALFYFL